jgi:hypothetical protein
MTKLLKTGSGWRIGWNPQATKYRGLVGTDDWAFELTEPELFDFCRLVLQLDETMKEMSEHLMAEEIITCEVESTSLWLEAEGFPHCYSLRILLHQGRCAEGNWHCTAVKDLIKAAASLLPNSVVIP